MRGEVLYCHCEGAQRPQQSPAVAGRMSERVAPVRAGDCWSHPLLFCPCHCGSRARRGLLRRLRRLAMTKRARRRARSKGSGGAQGQRGSGGAQGQRGAAARKVKGCLSLRRAHAPSCHCEGAQRPQQSPAVAGRMSERVPPVLAGDGFAASGGSQGQSSSTSIACLWMS